MRVSILKGIKLISFMERRCDKMSRVIKFRAWDKKSNKMLQNNTKFVIWEDGSWTCKDGFTNDTLLINEDFAVLMQYTGLKDKNGVEIYEGDVVHISSTNSCPSIDSSPKVIEWWNGMFCFDGGRGGDDKITFGWWVRSNDYSISLKQIEVIGNIYENPELLSQ